MSLSKKKNFSLRRVPIFNLIHFLILNTVHMSEPDLSSEMKNLKKPQLPFIFSSKQNILAELFPPSSLVNVIICFSTRIEISKKYIFTKQLAHISLAMLPPPPESFAVIICIIIQPKWQFKINTCQINFDTGDYALKDLQTFDSQ